MLKEVDIAIIGGGPAGLSAGISSGKSGKKVLILERNDELGGVLNQCIHPGFGLVYYKEELTGPEYAQKLIQEIKNLENVEYFLNTMVLQIKEDKEVIAVNSDGLWRVKAKAIIFSTGCRERTRGNLQIPGDRPSGIYTAGTAQRLVNIEGYLPGEKILILGSGDIGLIMARRLLWEGAEVIGVVEKLPYPGGLTRNLVQCLEDYNIPLYLKHTVVEIKGKDRVEGVYIAPVDEQGNPILEAKKFIECDTLLLSVGLIPENELLESLNIPIDPKTGGPLVDQNLSTLKDGFFSCGNSLLVNDLVDYVTMQGILAGDSAVRFIEGKLKIEKRVKVEISGNLRIIVPQYVSYPINSEEITFYMRVKEPQKSAKLILQDEKKKLKEWRYPMVKPAEMILVKLKTEDLKEIEYLEFSMEG
ncbi:NAD(P)/FAD-dependent oxidoreductase [Dictyoglomus thermophilum]|uniref:NAD(FAD)-dependent dehydrogenase n=2 Tax=Dictyoglomus thermophilum TaxID=14 RepID=B5YB14_DICT6|nr:NAD(P)/FAD-dependent oxidoreductase [Dictyoglomus thermophilum]ACI18284.1 NAD(FAD)-dependent dehydrogenase [Dictyoglomus thermophilum H-6-12]MCX7720596.1 NAD(P)/FAD-dependent oxidoreductase [Dictyoglomus thermophilum]TYT24256.1 FAD-dependent oxidoreductase [Dictyoglomus thermophilum]